MQPNRAHRNDFQTHTDDELVTMMADDQQAREEAVNKELSDLTAIASLNDHPGWQMMKKSFEKKIENIRSGAVLAAAILDAEVSDEQLGQLTRTTNLVAAELETLLMTVEAAVEARKEELDDRPKRRKL